MIVQNLYMEFGNQIIFDDLHFQIKEKEKIGIVGVNGAGKSTFFKLILKELEPTSGRIILPRNTRIGFLPQVISDNLPDTKISVLDFLLEARPIKKLQKELREIIELSYYQDLNQREISEKMNMSQMQVSRRLKKALNKMYELINKSNGED